MSSRSRSQHRFACQHTADLGSPAGLTNARARCWPTSPQSVGRGPRGEGAVHNLGLKAVAEGIETRDQLDRLRDLGFPYGQVFLLAKPMPADECAALMAAPAAVPAA